MTMRGIVSTCVITSDPTHRSAVQAYMSRTASRWSKPSASSRWWMCPRSAWLMPVCPPQAAHDGGEGVDDGHGGDHERDDDGREAGEPRHREQRDRPERKAEREGAGVAHEDGGGMEIVAEEPERGPRDGDGERRGVKTTGLHGEHEHREAREGRDAGGEAVEAIDQVDDVRVGHEVDDRDGVREPAEADVRPAKRVGDVADDEAAGDGDGCGEDLSAQLLERGQRVAVVEEPRDKDGEEGDDEHPVVDLERRRGDKDDGPVEIRGAHVLDHERGNDAAEDGDAAHARDGLLVDAAGAGVVNGADAHGNVAGERSRGKRREQRGTEKAQVGYPARNHLAPFHAHCPQALPMIAETERKRPNLVTAVEKQSGSTRTSSTFAEKNAQVKTGFSVW